MSTDTLEFPPIDEAAAPASTALAEQQPGAVDLTKIDLQAVALAGFNPARAALATAKATLKGVQHDFSTPTKLADGKSLRNRLLKVPLADARATCTALKSRLTKVSKAVGDELVAIEADFEAADKLITPQIDAAQAKLDAEREAARLKEEARVQAHRDALAKLAAPAEKAADPDMTAERIAKGIELVEAITIDRAAWEDFADRAEEQKAVTLERMRALHTKAVVAEAEALRLAEEKAEAERVAAANKAEADRLAKLAVDLAQREAELKVESDRIAAETKAREDAERVAADAKAQADREQAAFEAWIEDNSPSGDVDAVQRQWAASAEFHELHGLEYRRPAPAYTPSVEQAALIERGREIVDDIIAAEVLGDAIAAAPSKEPSTFAEAASYYRSTGQIPERPAEVPMLKLGELWTQLGLDDREAFLASLGFPSTPAPKGTGKLYRESDVQAIRRAIATRMTEAADFLETA